MNALNAGRSGLLTLMLLGVLLTGCAGTVKNMREADPASVSMAPAPGMAKVVFMRPSGLGYAIQSSVFDVDNSRSSLIGIVAAKKKLVYETSPGEHLFMVIGESADFMSADLEAGKTYYALVTPRMGLWKARFSLKPVHADELDTDEFTDWLTSCDWVEKNSSSDSWALENMPSIEDQRVEYYEMWMGKDESERPRLNPGDGKVFGQD